MKPIKIIEVKSDFGASTLGASLGIDALKKAARKSGSIFFNMYKSEEVPVPDKILNEPFHSSHARNIKVMINICEELAHKVRRNLDEGNFPIVLGGDHSIATGSISGVKMAHPDGRVAVIWIDAHADLHSPYTSETGNIHGMPLASVLGEDNMIMKINEVNEDIVNNWEKYKNIGGISPKIDYKDLVYIGLRDFESQEDYLVKKNEVTVITANEVKDIGIDKVVQKVFDSIVHCDYIYVSFDVDSMDPSVSKGTGISVPKGISEIEAEGIILGLLEDKRVCCLEITEINPTLDDGNIMAEKVFNIMQKVENLLNK